MLDKRFSVLRTIQALICSRHSFALLRLPYAATIDCIITTPDSCNPLQADFQLAPFASTRHSIVFKAACRLSCSLDELPKQLMHHGILNAADIDAISLTMSHDVAKLQERCHSLNATVKDRYTTAFTTFVQALKERRFSKLVLARPFYCLPRRLLGEVWLQLQEHYPQACCYLVHDGGDDIYLGATPETLADIEADVLHTMSLAGTMHKNSSGNYVWSNKNLQEQQVVTDYILQTLQPFCQAIKAQGPATHDAGPVVHLCTRIQATLRPSTKAEEVIAALHPTPAVCGVPTAEAMNFIRQHEGFDRNFYAGFIGFKQGSRQHYFVNLRCLHYDGAIACLYAGGGILANSQLDAEWQETEHKLQTLREFI